MPSTAQCIYCGDVIIPSRGEGDHIIPSLLGEFSNDFRFRRICKKCNSIIGRSEQQIVQSGREGFFRQFINPQSKRLKYRSTGKMRGAMGAPAPQRTITLEKYKLLVESMPNNPRDIELVDHILVKDAFEKESFVRLFSGIRPEQIHHALKKKGIHKMSEVCLHCSKENYDEFVKLLEQLWPDSQVDKVDPIPPGMYQNIPAQINFTVNTCYFRAIAKIGFHYYLTHSQRGFKGDEPCFSAIRHFIIHGGDADQFFKCDKKPKFVLPFGELHDGKILTPTQWCHMVAMCEDNGRAFAYVQLFIGPGYIPSSHCIGLGHWDNPIIMSNVASCHVYKYYDSNQISRYAGQVDKVQMVRMR